MPCDCLPVSAMDDACKCRRPETDGVYKLAGRPEQSTDRQDQTITREHGYMLRLHRPAGSKLLRSSPPCQLMLPVGHLPFDSSIPQPLCHSAAF
ncbi:hypothetical protein GUJ93_ZPchr0458g22883 [Zizania palustris]|uniref:Uncharacterized protein n=1 Tax=Zizania palustris TaxID=103762 RepID=A0A8J5QV22_ZIZPA|nr:hypothetical protein GUJ93_ZPchr0458g22883 [Zizania palustris]